MGIEITKTIIKTCDVCGREVKHFAGVNKYMSRAVPAMTVSRYGVAVDVQYYLCQQCSDAVIELLDDLESEQGAKQ